MLDFSKHFYMLDGGMGTMLQAYGLEPGEPPALLAVTNPELITSIHRQYVEAGADILYANTFGTNRYKLEGYGYSPGQIAKKTRWWLWTWILWASFWNPWEP